MKRKGGWIQTATGRAFWPMDPRAEEIDILDVAHGLSNLCRWTGAVREFYSVAEHSVRVSLACDPKDALWGLLHDASEAYLSDIARPTKHDPAMKPYRLMEERVMMEVCKAFALTPYVTPASVKHADQVLLVTEHRDLMLPSPRNDADLPPVSALKDHIDEPWTPLLARSAFMARYRQLTSERRIG